ncbi:MAG: phytanoyl-CoA dioxygenase family protein [Pseudomonadota bacterium]
MRRLYRLSNGRSNDIISRLLSLRFPPQASGSTEVDGVLGNIDEKRLKTIVEAISEDGFYRFEQKLSSDQLDSLLEFAHETPCDALLPSSGERLEFTYAPERKLFRNSVESVKYNFRPSDLLRTKSVQKLILDPTILAVAENYLRCKPILDLVAMWWSKPSKQPSSEAAQFYHFDMDRIKFLKFFIYLTDVNSDTGPHCYVRGSCKRKPEALCKDGRVSDDEISQHFHQVDMVEIVGQRGTIIAADTRGFHKGKQLLTGERLMLQFEFANSMFGANYEPVDAAELDIEFRSIVQANPRLFGLVKC